MNCIFCEIINNNIPSNTIYENDYVKCFLDNNPNSLAHILVVPKKHFVDMMDIDNTYLKEVIEAGKKMMKLVTITYNAKGIRLLQNNGMFEEVKHFHMHIVNDIKYNNEDLSKICEELKSNMGRI